MKRCKGSPYANSTDVPWYETTEHFVLMGRSFDVNLAKKIVKTKARAISELPTKDVAPWLRKPGSFAIMGITVDWTDVSRANIDLTIPVLIANLTSGLLPIDGWHRISLAVEQQLETLPCILLTKTETKTILW